MSHEMSLKNRQSIIVATCRALKTGKDRAHTAAFIRNAHARGWWWANLGRDVAEQVLHALDTNRNKKDALLAFIDVILSGPDYSPQLAFGKWDLEIMDWYRELGGSEPPPL